MSVITEIFICAFCLANIVYMVFCAWNRDILSMMCNKEWLKNLMDERADRLQETLAAMRAVVDEKAKEEE